MTPVILDSGLMAGERGNSTCISEPAHVVRLEEPRIDDDAVVFRWEVTPKTELYSRTEFTMSFPPEIDLSAIPRPLWWRIALICLHTHWVLLRPCRVELPVRLGAGEGELWMRLMDNVRVQLEAYGSPQRAGRAVELMEAGPRLEPVRLETATDRAVAAFSGGKDSLVLSALLAELTERPLLVTITSPVPWARDHVGGARDRAQKEIVQRLPADLLTVSSDFRTCWAIDFSTREGCSLGVHELSDLSLYQSAMIAVAAATGRGRMFIASEADIQYNATRDGRVILHREFLSCSVTQGALDALLRGFGLRQSSLTYPLHMPEVQGLLLHRYRHLLDLQFSCWKAPYGTQACSTCSKCFQIALVALAEGVSPWEMGIDPVAALCAFGDWNVDSPPPSGVPRLHETRAARHHIQRRLQELSSAAVAETLTSDPVARDNARLGEALAVYARLRADALALDTPPAPGYFAGLLELVPSDLRKPLRAIFDQYFFTAPTHELTATIERAQALTSWIVEPLQGATGPQGSPLRLPGDRRGRRALHGRKRLLRHRDRRLGN